MSIYDLIDQKVIDYAEIVVCLFDHCNLNCIFCPQIHDDVLGASRKEILAKTESITSWINNNNRSQYFKIHLMGGELFQDRWTDIGFLDYYKEFVTEIRSGVTDKNKEVHINFVSNLVFSNVNTVLDFLNKNEYGLSVSYDPVGRFNVNQRQIFIKNIEHFKNNISMISMQMTKQNILAILNGDEYFDYLYNNFLIDWDSFIPAINGSEKLMPKESELLEFYKLLVTKYPKCLNVDHFVNQKEQNKMTCTRGNNLTVLKDGTIPPGCSSSLFVSDNASKTEDVVTNFLDKYNCFECEFYKRCPLTCFVKANYSKIVEDIDDCVFKETFKYIDSIHQSPAR